MATTKQPLKFESQRLIC